MLSPKFPCQFPHHFSSHSLVYFLQISISTFFSIHNSTSFTFSSGSPIPSSFPHIFLIHLIFPSFPSHFLPSHFPISSYFHSCFPHISFHFPHSPSLFLLFLLYFPSHSPHILHSCFSHFFPSHFPTSPSFLTFPSNFLTFPSHFPISSFFSLAFLSLFLSLTFLYSAVSISLTFPPFFCHFPPILPSRSPLISLPTSPTFPHTPPAHPAQRQRAHRQPARPAGRGGLTPHSTWRRATPKMAAAGGKRRAGRLKMAPGGAKGDGGRRACAARHAAARHAPCRDVPCVRGAR